MICFVWCQKGLKNYFVYGTLRKLCKFLLNFYNEFLLLRIINFIEYDKMPLICMSIKNSNFFTSHFSAYYKPTKINDAQKSTPPHPRNTPHIPSDQTNKIPTNQRSLTHAISIIFLYIPTSPIADPHDPTRPNNRRTVTSARRFFWHGDDDENRIDFSRGENGLTPMRVRCI